MLEIGSEYIQVVCGTIFKYRVLAEKPGEFHGIKAYLVQNVETGFKLVMCDTELHSQDEFNNYTI